MPTDPIPSRCPRCGAVLPADGDGTCPACLLSVAAGPDPASASAGSGDSMTRTALESEKTPAGRLSRAPRLAPGQTFGPYRIEKLLGRGGMGEVYAAEHREHGRRVAVKVLAERLASDADRARFLREGQLAASINHPNSVYIFGSEEIEDMPVITMELVAGGTLKDVVERDGPMAPAQAVDAILQVINGLDAAAAAGILHRDIKPSNCFVDLDGTVKVGDFGLSISTLAREATLTETGSFQGTPTYASPEQLRGEPLDVRSDLYAVGATLYYLLTGRPPFDHEDLMALVTKVATERAALPRAVKAALPDGLVKALDEMLAKDRANRPGSYAAMADLLRPFSVTPHVPAPLGFRLMAGAIDWILLNNPVVSFPLGIVALRVARAGGAQSIADPMSAFTLATVAVSLVLYVCYFGVLEGLTGASIGKRLLRLRVQRADASRIGVLRASLRALLWAVPASLFLVAAAFPPTRGWLPPIPPYLVTMLLFVTVRRATGNAGLHDLATATRVVRRALRDPVQRHLATAGAEGEPREDRWFGPYVVHATLGLTDVGELLLGFDPVLKRAVWVHWVPTGARDRSRRTLETWRRGQLRWLAGGQDATGEWDAFEALDGGPLLQLPVAVRPWRHVRGWMQALVTGLTPTEEGGPTSRLSLDRIWITEGGRVVLLDFAAPASTSSRPAVREVFNCPQRFVAAFVRHALGPLDHPRLPLRAAAALDELERGAPPLWPDVVTLCNRLNVGSGEVEGGRRAALLGLGVYVPAAAWTLVSTFAFLVGPNHPADVTVSDLAIHAGVMARLTSPAVQSQREAVEVVLADQYASLEDEDTAYVRGLTFALAGPVWPSIRAVGAARSDVSPDALAEASATTQQLVPSIRNARFRLALHRVPTMILAIALAAFGLFSVASAFLLRGSAVLSAAGIGVASRSGRQVSRSRAVFRAVLTWLAPLVCLLGLLISGFGIYEAGLAWRLQPVACGLAWASGLAWAAGNVWIFANPTRGLQDYVAGTWLVPR